MRKFVQTKPPVLQDGNYGFAAEYGVKGTDIRVFRDQGQWVVEHGGRVIRPPHSEVHMGAARKIALKLAREIPDPRQVRLEKAAADAVEVAHRDGEGVIAWCKAFTALREAGAKIDEALQLATRSEAAHR